MKSFVMNNAPAWAVVMIAVLIGRIISDVIS